MYKRSDSRNYNLPSINRSGYNTIMIVFAIVVVSAFISSSLMLIVLFIGIIITYFFRDPERIIPINEGLIVSPADGSITYLGIVNSIYIPDSEEIYNEDMHKVSIFLSPLNVHVTRCSVAGEIISINYIRGGFDPAIDNNVSEKNERNLVEIKNKNNERFFITQVAGFLAKRIVCNIKVNEKIESGNRIGIIKFGSRTDIYIPVSGYKILVTDGQTLIGGETIIASRTDIDISKLDIKYRKD